AVAQGDLDAAGVFAGGRPNAGEQVGGDRARVSKHANGRVRRQNRAQGGEIGIARRPAVAGRIVGGKHRGAGNIRISTEQGATAQRDVVGGVGAGIDGDRPFVEDFVGPRSLPQRNRIAGAVGNFRQPRIAVPAKDASGFDRQRQGRQGSVGALV